jgi:hypothetical protein
MLRFRVEANVCRVEATVCRVLNFAASSLSFGRSCQHSVQMDLDMYNSLLECAAGIAHATAANVTDMHSSNWRLGIKDGLRLIDECKKDLLQPDLVTWSGVYSDPLTD